MLASHFSPLALLSSPIHFALTEPRRGEQKQINGFRASYLVYNRV